jgi:hypothetical protein
MGRRWIPLAAFLAIEACAADPLAKIRAVGAEGEGNAEAGRAWRDVVDRGPEALPAILAAFDGAEARAANWLRAAVDAIAEKHPPDPNMLEAFVLETAHDGRGRRAAYEWLVRVDPGAPDRLLPGMLDDPGRELRREAVARSLAQAEKVLKDGDRKAAAEAFAKLLPHARDRDQVDALAKHLKGLGVPVDLQAHYGILASWAFITTFDNTGMKGFDVAYAPEKGPMPGAGLAGKGGAPVRVVEFTTPDPVGKVDLNTALGKEMGAIAYARAAVESPVERPVEVRVGTNNAVKIFLNGSELFFRNEYHHGMKMDQYVGRGTLRRGRNEVLLKICQNEQKEDWAQSWGFQARLCDALGGAVPFRSVTP